MLHFLSKFLPFANMPDCSSEKVSKAHARSRWVHVKQPWEYPDRSYIHLHCIYEDEKSLHKHRQRNPCGHQNQQSTYITQVLRIPAVWLFQKNASVSWYLFGFFSHVISSIDLSKITATIYSSELSKRLKRFLAACPPSGPLPHVNKLLVATSDFERDLETWKLRYRVESSKLKICFIGLW